jgi:serralysin
LSATAIVLPPARAAFHLWNIDEIYSNTSGTLQFVELTTTFGGQQSFNGQTITANNVGATQSHMFTMPSSLGSDTTNHHQLLATAAVASHGGPTPDFVLPDGFLFAAGGSIAFFGANGGSYTALPVDGTNSYAWPSGDSNANSTQNFAGQIGFVQVPEPSSLMLAAGAVGGLFYLLCRRRSLSGRS